MKLEVGNTYSYKIISKFLQENFRGNNFYENLLGELIPPNESINLINDILLDKIVKISKLDIMIPTHIYIYNSFRLCLYFEKCDIINKKYTSISLSFYENEVYVGSYNYM